MSAVGSGDCLRDTLHRVLRGLSLHPMSRDVRGVLTGDSVREPEALPACVLRGAGPEGDAGGDGAPEQLRPRERDALHDGQCRARPQNGEGCLFLSLFTLSHSIIVPIQPLAAFLSGIEDIFATVEECTSTNNKEGRLSGSYATTQLQLISDQVENVREVNSFMTMTINRCIDFTKTTTGVKLTALHETIGLDETLRRPVKIMNGFQTKIGIQLNAIPRGICSQVITDKQWLQENILCLLSNAVKYSSSRGEVALSLTLVTTAGLKSNRSVERSSGGSGMDSPRRHDEENLLLFEVEDNGIGISEDMMQELFKPFKQAQRLTGGTGLGLYSLGLYSLGGYYGVQQRKDGREGSLFWFAIRYTPDETAVRDELLAVTSRDQSLMSSSPQQHWAARGCRKQPPFRRRSAWRVCP